MSDCIIHTGDDAIAIRCDSTKLKNPKPCEYVAITNCVLSSNSSIFRVGVGTGEIHNVRVSNLTVSKAGSLISFCTSWAGIGNARIEDVSFSDISARNVLRLTNSIAEIGMVKKILMKNINMSAKGGIFITPLKTGIISDFTLRNIDIKITEKQLPTDEEMLARDYVIINCDEVLMWIKEVFPISHFTEI